MLNRNYRTLSANLLGLNLGTRSFAVATQTVLNNGTLTLRSRHVHSDRCVDPTLRAEDRWRSEPMSIMGSIPTSSGSLPPSWRLSRSAGSWWPRVEVVAEAPPRVGTVVAVVPVTDRTASHGQAQGRWQSQPQPPAHRKPLPSLRKFKRVATGKPGACRNAKAAAATTFAAFAPAYDRNAFVPVARIRAAGG